ncbi:MAG: formylglycine-generating enzyme family protein [Pirellulales bacterium]
MKLFVATILVFLTPIFSIAAEHVGNAADGTAIPHPTSKTTSVVKDGTTSIAVSESMVYIPAGEFTYGQGASAKKVNLSGYCIGKYHVTNAEFKAFLDANGGRAPSYWSKGTYPQGKSNHPVAFVSMSQATAYAMWVSKETGWNVVIPTSEQWEKAARGPKNTIYPWGDSMDVSLTESGLKSKFNYNGVIAADYLRNKPTLETSYQSKSAKYAGQKVTVEKIAAYDEEGRGTPFSVGPTGQVRGWVAHGTNTGFIGTELFHAISASGGNTTPVGKYESGKSGYGCYDMAGNLWVWCDTKIIATNGAEKGKEVYEIRGGSWYANGGSCKSISVGEGRAPSGACNTVGFRVALIPTP